MHRTAPSAHSHDLWQHIFLFVLVLYQAQSWDGFTCHIPGVPGRLSGENMKPMRGVWVLQLRFYCPLFHTFYFNPLSKTPWVPVRQCLYNTATTQSSQHPQAQTEVPAQSDVQTDVQVAFAGHTLANVCCAQLYRLSVHPEARVSWTAHTLRAMHGFQFSFGLKIEVTFLCQLSSVIQRRVRMVLCLLYPLRDVHQTIRCHYNASMFPSLTHVSSFDEQ